MLEFELGDRVFLKISKMKGVMRFRKKGKLALVVLDLFEITQIVGKLAYQVTLPSNLAGMHDVFHVSMLRKYIPSQIW
jgi:hypothetical protein